VLVRYNPEGDAALNQRQVSRLTRLSDYLHQTQTLFMFELLVPPEPMQLEQFEGDKNAYDLQLRPRLASSSVLRSGERVSGSLWSILRLNASPEGRQSHTLHTVLKNGFTSLRKPEAQKRLRSTMHKGGLNYVLHLWMQKALQYYGRCEKHCGKVF
jgi:hypothetical protein